MLQVKGNVYKNKRVLTEAIHREKADRIREKNISEQFEARRSKNKQTRERKLARREERLSHVCPQKNLYIAVCACAAAIHRVCAVMAGTVTASHGKSSAILRRVPNH